MFKWAIKKFWENYPDRVLHLPELKEVIGDVWNEMVNDGEIEFEN